MPFSSVDEFITRIPAFKNVPHSALSIALRVFNKVWENATGTKEQKDIAAIRAAWGVVKHQCHKVGDKWVKNEELDFETVSEERFETYVGNLSTPALLHWRAKIVAWSNRLREGKPLKFSKSRLLMFNRVFHKEFMKRDLNWHPQTQLDTEVLLAEYDIPNEDELAPVFPSGVERGDWTTREDVLQVFSKPFFLKRPLVICRGGISIHGRTKGDWDIAITYPRRIPERDMPLEFRLGRMIPSEFQNRIDFPFTTEKNYDAFGGPFTSFFPLYDLLVVPSKYRETVQMEELYTFLETTARLSEVKDETAREQAEAAREANKVLPLHFVLPVKPTIGHRERAYYSIEELLSLIKDGPWAVEKKYDGNWLILMKSGDDIVIKSEGGHDVTPRLPGTVAEMKKWPIGKLTIVSDSEKWTAQGEYIGRETVAAYLSGKTEPDDSGIVHNVFDVILYEDESLTSLPLKERLEYKKKLPIKQSTRDAPSIKSHFNVAPTAIASNEKEVKREVQIASSAKASEGAVIKSLESSYPLSGIGGKWWKIKSTADLNAIVLKALPTKTAGVCRYRVGLAYPSSWDIMRKATVGNKDYMDIGKTMNLKGKQLSVGTVVLVSYEEIFSYEDPDTGAKQLVFYVPNIMDVTDRSEPDDAEAVIAEAGKGGFLRRKEAKLSYWRSELEYFGIV